MTVTYDHVTTSSGAAGSFSFSSENIGTAASDRWIILAITARKNGSSTRTLSGVTINGVTATIHVQNQNTSDNSGFAAIASANVPTGTSVTISGTFSASMFRFSVGVFIVTGGMNGTPTGTGSTNTDNTGVGVAYVDQGVVIGCGHSVANAAAAAWTNLTEKYDASLGGDSTNTGAQSAAQSGSGTLTGTCDFTTATTISVAYTSFEPAAVGTGAPQMSLMGVGC